MSKLVGTHIYKYLEFSLKDHCRLAFKEPGSCVCWLIWKMFIYFKMPGGPQDDYFFGKQSTIDPCDGQEQGHHAEIERVKLKYMYIYKAHWYWRQPDISKIWCSFATHQNIFGTAVEAVIIGTHGWLVWRLSKVSRLLSEAREDVIRTLVYRRQCRHGSRVVEMSDGETRHATTGCGWLHSPFLGFFGWWDFSGVVSCSHPLGSLDDLCVCVCVFSPPLTSF